MKALSPKLARITSQEWRDLGFFYDSDDESREWRLSGDHKGLLQFVRALNEYSRNPRNAGVSEHDHLGPHSYLKVMTWPEAGIDGNSIHGTLADLERLAGVIEKHLAGSVPGDVVRIREQYALNAEYAIVLTVKPDGFDPATLDPQLRS